VPGLPWARARSRPAFTCSRIMARSNSAKGAGRLTAIAVEPAENFGKPGRRLWFNQDIVA
jgi:hypothetical protein